MIVEFNINKFVYVKLTEHGLDVLKEKHEDLRKSFPKLPEWREPIKNEDGYSKFQLWDLMSTFGWHVRLGAELPFDPEILFDVKE